MGRWRILCYHRVEPHEAGRFVRQLVRFRQLGWEFCRIEEGMRRRADPSGGDCVTVTFDDGNDSIDQTVRRVLDEQQVTATLYLTTGFACRDLAPPANRIGWNQLGRWLDAGHQIGSHTHTHADLTRCSDARAIEELSGSRDLIRQELGYEVAHFSYPWGQHSARTLQHLHRSGGWVSAATIDRGWNDARADALRLRRDVIEPGWTERQIRLRMRVAEHPLLYRLQRSVARTLWLRRPPVSSLQPPCELPASAPTRPLRLATGGD